MSSLNSEGLQKLKQQVCQEKSHDNQPILRICVNQQCQENSQNRSFLCADCFIHHSNHFQECIKIEQFIFKCQQNSQLNCSTYDKKFELIIAELNQQAKIFRKKVKEMFKSFKKQLKETYSTQIIQQLQSLQSNIQKQKNSQKLSLTISTLIRQYRGQQIDEIQIDYDSLFSKVSKSQVEYLNSLLTDFQNIFANKSVYVEKNVEEIKDMIQKHLNLEQVIQEEEQQRVLIRNIEVSQGNLHDKIKAAEEDKLKAQKELKSLQDKYFTIQEQEKIFFYKLEQKKKFDVESKRQFLHKIQNLNEKQIQIKFFEEQRIQLFDGLSSQEFLCEEPLNNNQNGIQILDQQKQQEGDIVHNLINQEQNNQSSEGIQQNNDRAEKNILIEQNRKQVKEIDLAQKQKYAFLEKQKLLLQKKQDEYSDIYSKDIEQLQNELYEIQQKKDECSMDLEKAKINYQEQMENLKSLQQEQYKNEDLKYSEKKKLLEIYKKSPIKKKILNI
ncbi:hypothetical protein ABPG72_006324 [Tetrahymena utriculariae]